MWCEMFWSLKRVSDAQQAKKLVDIFNQVDDMILSMIVLRISVEIRILQ